MKILARTSSIFLALGVAMTTHAQLRIEITSGVTDPIPIAVVPFASAGGGLDIADVVQGDLAGSGRFRALPREQMPAKPTRADEVSIANWRGGANDYIVVGRVSPIADGQLAVDFDLLNVLNGQRMVTQRFIGTPATLRNAAHRVSDVVYEKILGVRGAFATRIAYVSVTGTPPAQRSFDPLDPPFRPEVLGNASSSDTVGHARATKDDPWDGRASREEVFIQKIKALAPQVNVQDLDPILDNMRAFKSPREIAIIREATRITGLGIMEAMRDAKPGMFEYELQADAEFVFKKYGSQGAAYFALVATGQNTLYSHYHKNTAKLQDGDLVQFDYAPDYKYYVSDVTRVFPANGKFSAWQREYYTIYLRLYQALMASIKVHAAPRDIMKDAVVRMETILAGFKFSDPKIKEAATRFIERYRTSRSNSLGHTVGMEVHDVRLPTEALEPGQLFTIEPAMTIPEMHLGLRLEDVILMTETGYENLSEFVPVDVADIEKLMAETGLSDKAITLPSARRNPQH